MYPEITGAKQMITKLQSLERRIRLTAKHIAHSPDIREYQRNVQRFYRLEDKYKTLTHGRYRFIREEEVR